MKRVRARGVQNLGLSAIKELAYRGIDGITLRGGVLGSNEQIFGADEQLPKGGCGRCPKNAL
jgi:hypothetical protein